MTDKVAILGVGAPDFGQALTIAQEVERVEISNRRKFMDKVIIRHNEEQLFKKYLKLSSKELKKRSKGFNFIMRYIDGLGLERYYGTKAVPTTTQAHRISVMLNSLINSKLFTELDLEKADTDYFHLLVGLYICMKDVTANFMKVHPGHKGVAELTHVSSEIGLRLYSLYVDTRLDNPYDDFEEVKLR